MYTFTLKHPFITTTALCYLIISYGDVSLDVSEVALWGGNDGNVDIYEQILQFQLNIDLRKRSERGMALA